MEGVFSGKDEKRENVRGVIADAKKNYKIELGLRLATAQGCAHRRRPPATVGFLLRGCLRAARNGSYRHPPG